MKSKDIHFFNERSIDKAALSQILHLAKKLHCRYDATNKFDYHFKEKIILNAVRDSSSSIYFAKIKNEIIGYVLVYITNDKMPNGNIIKINEIFVLPQYRRTGVGSNLIQKSCEWATHNNATKIFVNFSILQNDIASFWKKCGFYPIAIKAGKKV